MNPMVFDLASVNLIIICMILFGAIGLLRIAKNYLES